MYNSTLKIYMVIIYISVFTELRKLDDNEKLKKFQKQFSEKGRLFHFIKLLIDSLNHIL